MKKYKIILKFEAFTHNEGIELTNLTDWIKRYLPAPSTFFFEVLEWSKEEIKSKVK